MILFASFSLPTAEQRLCERDDPAAAEQTSFGAFN